jgi:hypothetical protein
LKKYARFILLLGPGVKRGLPNVIAPHACSQQFDAAYQIISSTRLRPDESSLIRLRNGKGWKLRTAEYYCSLKLSNMKKILFLLFISTAWISCSKEIDFDQIAAKKKDSTGIFVDYKPMPKGVIPAETPNN